MRGAKGARKRVKRGRDKAVVRHLPPQLAEEAFWKSVAPWVRGAGNAHAASDDAPATVDYAVFVPGTHAARPGEPQTPARAYVRFIETPQLLAFYRAFHGYRFQDEKGAEYHACVDYAPIQLVPGARRAQADALAGTVEKMPEFQAFVASLNEAPAAPEPAEPAEPESTPLLDFLEQKRRAEQDAARRKKEAQEAKRTRKGKADGDTVTILQRPDKEATKAPGDVRGKARGAAPRGAPARGRGDAARRVERRP
ncbi:hypothetical protein MOBT1_002836 [Malassezia obtusa]|uniref:UPF3 domain-containing protein n=1 Tax=Malassezia obtusa TaxID=76774 RepID=A0AAF0E0Q0_9BASI|nr:hypothetical protein MOBT1_002836 [Malassezia obtusa]